MLYGVRLTIDVSRIFNIKQYYIKIIARCTSIRVNRLDGQQSFLARLWRMFLFVLFFMNLSLRINTET